jgi:hypothetical protein
VEFRTVVDREESKPRSLRFIGLKGSLNLSFVFVRDPRAIIFYCNAKLLSHSIRRDSNASVRAGCLSSIEYQVNEGMNQKFRIGLDCLIFDPLDAKIPIDTLRVRLNRPDRITNKFGEVNQFGRFSD